MRKILIFSTVYLPYTGGAELAVKEITDRIEGIEFDMVTIRFDAGLPAYEKIGNVNAYRLGFAKKSPRIEELSKFPLAVNKYLFPFMSLAKALQLDRKNNYSAIWSIMASYSGFGALFFKMLKPAKPFLLTLQEGDSFDFIKNRVGLLWGLYAQIFKKADRIQAISEYLAGYAGQVGFKGKVDVIPNGVDLENFTRQESMRDLESLKHGLLKKEGDIFLITTSRLVAKNGIDDAIKALPLLPANVKFLILGIGPDEEKLKSLANELGIADRTKFLGQISHNELPKYLKISDIFVRPSLSEGLGSSFLEAMAAGLPVIATPVGGISDFLFDPEKNPDKEPTGLFCEVKNPESIARKVGILLENDELKNSIISNGGKMAREKYGWEMISGKINKILTAI